jgi:hypothetical protein
MAFGPATPYNPSRSEALSTAQSDLSVLGTVVL